MGSFVSRTRFQNDSSWKLHMQGTCIGPTYTIQPHSRLQLYEGDLDGRSTVYLYVSEKQQPSVDLYKLENGEVVTLAGVVSIQIARDEETSRIVCRDALNPKLTDEGMLKIDYIS